VAALNGRPITSLMLHKDLFQPECPAQPLQQWFSRDWYSIDIADGESAC